MSIAVRAENTLSDIERLRGWLPVDAVVRDGTPVISWLDMRDVALSEPFFFQTVERVRLERPLVREIFTGYDVLIRSEKLFAALRPSGFIFHSSRSGSTVITNTLKALERVLTLSEPDVVDKLVSRFFTDVADDRRRELIYAVLLRAAVNALGQRRAGNERAYFLKFSSVSTAQIPRIAEIWPQVPAIFVYRHPIEIMVSNLNDPPRWLNQQRDVRIAAQLIGTEEAEVSSLSQEEFCARMVAAFFRAALISGPSLRLINYAELSLDGLMNVMRTFDLKISGSEQQAITEVMSRYSKDRQRQRDFESDSTQKRQLASKLAWEMAERWALDPYEQLEQKRSEQNSSGTQGTTEND